MKRVLIIGVSFEQQEMIEDVMKVSSAETFSVETTASFGQPAAWWNTTPPDVLIIQLPTDESLQVYFFNKVRTDLPKTLPILFICETISSQLMQLTGVLQKVRILKTPLESQDLWKGLQDLLANYPNTQAVAYRYATEQDAIISSDFREGQMQARLRNISVSGAYCEVQENTLKLKRDEMIRVQVSLGENREYLFDCKLVWIKDLEGGGTGFGMTFLDREAALNNLLKG